MCIKNTLWENWRLRSHEVNPWPKTATTLYLIHTKGVTINYGMTALLQLTFPLLWVSLILILSQLASLITKQTFCFEINCPNIRPSYSFTGGTRCTWFLWCLLFVSCWCSIPTDATSMIRKCVIWLFTQFTFQLIRKVISICFACIYDFVNSCLFSRFLGTTVTHFFTWWTLIFKFENTLSVSHFDNNLLWYILIHHSHKHLL